MNRQDEADYTALKEYLCDMILEEQLKLGYERETIRFYSPSSSIGHVLKLSDRSKPAVLAALEGSAHMRRIPSVKWQYLGRAAGESVFSFLQRVRSMCMRTAWRIRS